VSVEEIVEKTAGKLVVPDNVPEMTFWYIKKKRRRSCFRARGALLQ
jgi:hypothetical protein